MQKIEKYIHHPLVKKLGANFAWLSILQATSYLFPLITIPYIARVVGTWGYGKIAFASAVIVWFQTITDWGFQYTSTRDVARVREDKLKVSQKYSNTLWARIILMFCAAAILLVLTLLIPKFRENWLVLLSTFLLIPGHILCPDWFFQALERMKYITILNICAKLIFTVCIFIFIHERNQYFLQPLFISLGYIVTGFISIYIIVVKWGYRIQKPNFAEIFEEIKSSADVFINNVVPNFYNSFSVILLGFYCGPTANGLLDVGNKFTSIGQQINILISRTFFPTLSRNIQ